MRISGTAIMVVVVVAIVLFGAKRLPELARSLGQSMRILKSEAKAMRSDGTEDEGGAAPAPAPAVGSDHGAAKTIQAAPGAAATARPVAEPAADGDRPH
ncbi:Sec-independent protein translocase subunit TatA [Kitasatospora aureofaciens]|uniref:Sec-independent protein translocase subunit TatA n=1 Tax=Kitasatospora aureofaciens TaxID=1894 RepID=UPI001C485C3C|nr:Sec-independent protein translocase subunit TatA [Kitasatospora aureofaciens]MBV6700960.1 Sec-independent protein translocase subunit TatA [Kitasatospora aureofaciens]